MVDKINFQIFLLFSLQSNLLSLKKGETSLESIEYKLFYHINLIYLKDLDLNPVFIKTLQQCREIEDLDFLEGAKEKMLNRLINCLELEIKELETKVDQLNDKYNTKQEYEPEEIVAQDEDFSGEKIVNLKMSMPNYNLKYVEDIFIVNSHLDMFPKEILNCEKLINLSLHENHIKTIPDQINTLTNLTSIQLDYNLIFELPSSFSKLKNLQHLSLAGNNLDFIPGVIYTLKQLRFLYLCDNNIKSIGKNILNLYKLEALDLSNNKLLECNFISKLTNVEMINLSHNNLTKIPSLHNLKFLHFIDLSNNNLLELPNDICGVKCLGYINLSNNPNLILSDEQKKWLDGLVNYNCIIEI